MWFVIVWILFVVLRDVRAKDPSFSTVFQPNDGKYPCYRQPAIITTNIERTHLLVFAEGRFVSTSDCAPPFDEIDGSSTNENGGLEMRRSTDSGMTWSSAQTIYSGNMDFYTVVWDSREMIIYLMLETSSNVLIFTSDNEGKSWSDPTPLNVYPPPPFNKMSRPAVGHGIEIVNGSCNDAACVDGGVLLMPFICMNGSSHSKENDVCANCHACILRGIRSSTNRSRIWNFTGIAQPYTRESQLVQLLNRDRNVSSIYLNARNFSPHPGHRYFARSIDGGAQFTDFGLDQQLIEPVTKSWTGVVSSIARLSFEPSRILFSGPTNPTIRSNLTLHLSSDEAHSWSFSRVLYPGLSAYSDIAVLHGGEHFAIVFENGEKTFADRISVALVSTEWIENE